MTVIRSGRIARWARRRRRADDLGFTLVEMVVTLFIVAIIVPLTYGLIGNLSRQSVDLHDTVVGLQQDQIAGDALTEYLHGAVTVLPASSATTLAATIEAGYNASTGTQDIATLQAQLVPPAGSIDASLIITITPQGGTTSNVGTYYVVNTANPFTYYYYATAGTTAPSCGAVTPTTTTNPPNGASESLVATNNPCAVLGSVVGVGVDIQFLAGPQQGVAGYQAVQPTTFQTTVYLQNANAPAPTTATNVSFPNTSPSHTQTPNVAFVISVSPVPDGGTVSAVVTRGSTTVTNSCSGATSLSATTGAVSCTFSASGAGTYSVVATYTGATPASGTSYTGSTSVSTTVAVT